MENKNSIKSNISSDECRIILEELLRTYMTPAFGILPKHEIDMMMYDVLQKVGYLEKTPTPYELVRKLKVTRSKAQSLIYESNLRQSKDTDDELKEMLRDVLTRGSILIYVDKIGIEIENPLLRDYIRQCLKKEHCITDASYSSDILRMTPSAYQKLCEKYAIEEYQSLMSALERQGIEVDDNKKVFIEVIKSLATIVGGEGAGSLVEIIDGRIKDVAYRIKKSREEEKENEKQNTKKSKKREQ